jgi:hypothetical protein
MKGEDKNEFNSRPAENDGTYFTKNETKHRTETGKQFTG